MYRPGNIYHSCYLFSLSKYYASFVKLWKLFYLILGCAIVNLSGMIQPSIRSTDDMHNDATLQHHIHLIL